MAGGGYRHSTVQFESLQEYSKTGYGKEFLKKLKYATIGSTIHAVSNCEDVTDWDISSSGNFNAVDETSTKVTGSASMELVDVSTTTGTYVTLDDGHCPNKEDWTEFNWLCMWVYDDTGLRLTGELKVQIKNSGTWGTALSVPVNTTASKWEYKCIDISDEARGCVEGFRFVNNRGTGSSEKVYVDDIIVTDIITGNGDATQAGSGPVRGPIRAFTVASGQTLNPGEFVNLEAGEAHAGVQNDTAVIGVVCQDEPFTSVVGADATPKEVLVACNPAIVILRNDGSGSAAADPVMIASGNVSVSEATTNLTYYVAVALDTATASADSLFELKHHTKES